MNKLELAEKHILLDEHYVEPKAQRPLNIFWLGFIVYTSAYTLSSVLPSYNNILERLLLGSFVLMIGAAFFLVRFRIENSYLKFVYIIYITWLCFTVVRGFQFNYEFISNSIYDSWLGILLYFTPIIMLFSWDIVYLRKVFSVIVILGIIFLVCCLLFRNELLANYEEDTGTNQSVIEYLARHLSIPAGFLLITYPYQSNKRRFFAFVIVAVTLFLALIRARRAILFMEVSYLLSFYFIYLYINKIKFKTLVISVVLIAGLAFGGVKLYNQFKGSTFEFITERIDQDTRTGVEVCMYDDMTTRDWIIGKGMEGKYFCPGIDHGIFTDYRSLIETDYLNIILKGGLISFILLLLITVPAAILGIFYSKNLISKAAGIWIFLWLTDLYPIVVSIFSLQYLIVWICVGICFSREIRNMPEENIKKLLSVKKNKPSFL